MDLTAAINVMRRTHLAAYATLATEHPMRANGLHLESAPGVGKSDGTEQYAAELAAAIDEPVGMVIFMLATISSVDVKGFLLPVKNGAVLDSVFSTPPWMPTKANAVVFMPDGTRYDAGAYPYGSGGGDDEKILTDVPRVGVLFLDEFSQAEDDVKKPAAELVYKGAVGTARLPIGWRVVSAGNRMKDRSGVLRELMFLVNRRCALYVQSSLSSWGGWADRLPPHLRPHFLTRSFVQKSSEVVFTDAVPSETGPYCTSRSLVLMDRDLQSLRSPEDVIRGRMPMDDVARQVCAGWIGDGAAAQYFAHLKYGNEIPEWDDVVAAPTTAKLPPNKDAQMVCGYMLAANITTKNVKPVMTYLKRLLIDMQVLSVNAMLGQGDQTAKSLAIIASPEMTGWLDKHRDLLVASRS